MKLQVGQKVIVNGTLWDCVPSQSYSYTNAEGYVVKHTSGWPVININGVNKAIAWDHIQTNEK
jgi:hypothetical protein